MILSVNNLTKKFGGVNAVHNCSFDVKKNCLTGLIGPNGSGKTTLFNLILNYLQPDSGTVYFDGNLITGLKPFQLARRKIGRTFQKVRVFKKLTLIENLKVASISLSEERSSNYFRELLELVGLEHEIQDLARNLSYGEQKLLELAMALIPDPKLLLLDEPVAGLNSNMVSRLTDLIQDLKKAGKTFILIEHNVPFITGCCEDIIVLDRGKVIAKGTSSDIQNNDLVIEAYLGGA